MNNRTVRLLTTLLMVVVIGWVDYKTGWELGFFVFYFIPVSFAAWYIGAPYGIAMAFVSAITWLVADLCLARHYSSILFEFWNSAIRLVAFLLIASLVATIRRSLDKEKKIAAELRESFSQVKQLRGMLPICASCKKVRNDKGYWERIEQYIASRSEAEFTHGLCPECTQRLYPELTASSEQQKKSAR